MIQLKNLTLRRGVKVVLQNASVTLNPGEKVGLVGRNGAGKSSLFSLIANRLQADAGDLEMPPTWRLGEVAQNMPETAQGATDFVLDGDLPLMEARAALAAAEAAEDGNAIGEAYVLLEQAGTFDAASRAQALLLGLGFRTDQLDAPVNSFSGGWRMRLQLARALMCPADLLLLDEPTNHLDLDALVWLEGWLKRYNGLMIVISHDREFLDAITNVTVHLDATPSSPATAATTAPSRPCAPSGMEQAAGRLWQAAGEDRPPAALHRPLQGQGQQGQAGAEPGEGAGPHGQAGSGAGGQRSSSSNSASRRTCPTRCSRCAS